MMCGRDTFSIYLLTYLLRKATYVLSYYSYYEYCCYTHTHNNKNHHASPCEGCGCVVEDPSFFFPTFFTKNKLSYILCIFTYAFSLLLLLCQVWFLNKEEELTLFFFLPYLMTSCIVDSQNRKKNLDIMSRLPRKAGKMLGLSTTPDCLKAKEEVRKEQSHESFVWMFKNRSEEMLPGEDVGVDKDQHSKGFSYHCK